MWINVEVEIDGDPVPIAVHLDNDGAIDWIDDADLVLLRAAAIDFGELAEQARGAMDARLGGWR